MRDAISGRGGVVNQMVGDGLMAIFGAPLPHADAGGAAVQAALDMSEMIEPSNREPARAGRPPLAIGIGIASGTVIAGYTGTQQRATYTCVGDAVNLAARLEQLNKQYGTRILLSDKTAERCPDFALRKLADAEIRGYGEPIALYTPA
mgnify:CR=1 FL=1